MAASHATNYSFKNCIINYFTPLCGYLWMMMIVIMKWLCVNDKNGLYGPFGTILKNLAAENGNSKK